MTADISEIFQSIQGEGPYAGVRQVFVRFFRCHMHCVWCDTPAAIGDAGQNYETLALEDVWARVTALAARCHSVSLTGGEPLLQKDFLAAFLPRLKTAGLPAYLETSGVCFEALAGVVRDVAMVAMDIKLPSSTGCAPLWREHEAFLDVLNTAPGTEYFVKAVVSVDTVPGDIEQMIDLLRRRAPKALLILQPNSLELRQGVAARCLEFQDLCLRSLKHVRVLPQAHKFMKLR